MLGLFIAGLIAAFWLGFFLAAVVANEKREEELLQMAKKIEDIKRRSGMYPDKSGQKWLTLYRTLGVNHKEKNDVSD
jgi:hypothetical protein